MKNNKKGFTLAELLIVVAIIAVLVAVAIPVLTNQLENSRESTDAANLRSAYAVAAAGVIEYGENVAAGPVVMTQKTAGWQSNVKDSKIGNLVLKEVMPTVSENSEYYVQIDTNGVLRIGQGLTMVDAKMPVTIDPITGQKSS